MLNKTSGVTISNLSFPVLLLQEGRKLYLCQSGFTKWALTRRISTALHICGQQYLHKPESGHGTPKIQEQSYNHHLVT